MPQDQDLHVILAAARALLPIPIHPPKNDEDLGDYNRLLDARTKLRQALAQGLPGQASEQELLSGELDEDGCPTEEALQHIREFKPKSRQDWHQLFDFVRSLWIYENYFDDAQKDKGDELVHEYRISTAGWSGHEDVISALQDNVFFWLDCWYSSQRGGHYRFVTEAKLSPPADNSPS